MLLLLDSRCGPAAVDGSPASTAARIAASSSPSPFGTVRKASSGATKASMDASPHLFPSDGDAFSFPELHFLEIYEG